MKNKTLEKIRNEAIRILVMEHGDKIIQEGVSDSCVLLVHLDNGTILRVRIEEIKPEKSFDGF